MNNTIHLEAILNKENLEAGLKNGLTDDQVDALTNVRLLARNFITPTYIEYLFKNDKRLVEYLEGGIKDMLESESLYNHLEWDTFKLSREKTQKRFEHTAEFLVLALQDIRAYLLGIDKKYKTNFAYKL